MTDPTGLKQQLRTDLTTAMKARDKVRSGTLRMVLTAISEAEVSGRESHELTEQQVLDVVIKEAKKRREAEEAYTNADRPELAEKERVEGARVAGNQPPPHTPHPVAPRGCAGGAPPPPAPPSSG